MQHIRGFGDDELYKSAFYITSHQVSFCHRQSVSNDQQHWTLPPPIWPRSPANALPASYSSPNWHYQSWPAEDLKRVACLSEKALWRSTQLLLTVVDESAKSPIMQLNICKLQKLQLLLPSAVCTAYQLQRDWNFCKRSTHAITAGFWSFQPLHRTRNHTLLLIHITA